MAVGNIVKVFDQLPTSIKIVFRSFKFYRLTQTLCQNGFLITQSNLFLIKNYLFTFREKGRKGDREGNINVWLPLKRPHWGPGPPPTYVSWLEIQPMTLWFISHHSIHWATPARANLLLKNENSPECLWRRSLGFLDSYVFFCYLLFYISKSNKFFNVLKKSFTTWKKPQNKITLQRLSFKYWKL